MSSPLASILILRLAPPSGTSQDTAFGLFAVSKSGLSLTRLFQEGESVPGSTDFILLMGILIVLLIVIPIVWTRRQWMR